MPVAEQGQLGLKGSVKGRAAWSGNDLRYGERAEKGQDGEYCSRSGPAAQNRLCETGVRGQLRDLRPLSVHTSAIDRCLARTDRKMNKIMNDMVEQQRGKQAGMTRYQKGRALHTG